MTTFATQRRVAAPRATTFEVFSDFQNAASTVSAIERIEMLTEGPNRVGARFRETRTMFGRPATETMEVSAFDPPRSYTLAAESHGARYATTFTFTEAAGGTEVEMRFVVTPVTFMAKVMGLLMKPMMKKMVAVCAKDLEDLARVAEARAQA